MDICVPPSRCEYAQGACDQLYEDQARRRAFFAYASAQPALAATIEEAVRQLNASVDGGWHSWKSLDIAGQLIFCQICKAIRFADCLVADVTTLNFNVLFEAGYALGLGLPVIPTRDTSFGKHRQSFDEFGLLDTVGYTDFQNAGQLVEGLRDRYPFSALPSPGASPNYEAPLFVMKGPHNTEGDVRLMSAIKKSVVRFRVYDSIETPRLSLYSLRRNIAASLGVVVHLIDSERDGATVHNARCAMAAGMAMASGKVVQMLQEGNGIQPIDYRDVVTYYREPGQIASKLDRPLFAIIEALQQRTSEVAPQQEGLIQKLDIGDVAAENEIRSLRSYFVETGQYQQARRGHARLVVGRKGSGKSAIFYAMRDSFGRSNSRIVLDLKPEGHQFAKLREAILEGLTPGVREHTLTAFWNYILLSEMAHKVLDEEYGWAQRDPERQQRFLSLEEAYKRAVPAASGDFSERLLAKVDDLLARHSELVDPRDPRLTERLFGGAIGSLNESVSKYLEEKQDVWLLVDNLDKGWPTRGATDADILVIRSLLEATRKLQRGLERRDISFHCLVFLRNDIYEHLVMNTPDKGKDTAIDLDWSDPEFFKQIFCRRVNSTGVLVGDFEEVWQALFEPTVGLVSSFDFVLHRTLMRPRDFLNFIHRSIEVAANRGHDRVAADDLRKAEELYSSDILESTHYELKDVYPGSPDFIYEFLGVESSLEPAQVNAILGVAGISDIDEAIRLLAWFGFLGVQSRGSDSEVYSFQVRYNLKRLMLPIKRKAGRYVIHPAFLKALQ